MENTATELPDGYTSWIDFYIHLGKQIGFSGHTFVTFRRPTSNGGVTEYNFQWATILEKVGEEVRQLIFSTQEFEFVRNALFIAYGNYCHKPDDSVFRTLGKLSKISFNN